MRFARKPNYGESKVAPYTLEDPLVFVDGTRLTSPEQWPARRAEILNIFAREMYGRTPLRRDAPRPFFYLFSRHGGNCTLFGSHSQAA